VRVPHNMSAAVMREKWEVDYSADGRLFQTSSQLHQPSGCSQLTQLANAGSSAKELK